MIEFREIKAKDLTGPELVFYPEVNELIAVDDIGHEIDEDGDDCYVLEVFSFGSWGLMAEEKVLVASIIDKQGEEVFTDEAKAVFDALAAIDLREFLKKIPKDD